MSLTSYRTAPPRASWFCSVRAGLVLRPPGLSALPRWGAKREKGLGVLSPATFCFAKAVRERCSGCCAGVLAFAVQTLEYWSGGDLLSHVLRRSTIGATGLNGRVRDGTGCFPRAVATRPSLGSQREPSEGRMPSTKGGAGWRQLFLRSKRSDSLRRRPPLGVSNFRASSLQAGALVLEPGAVRAFAPFGCAKKSCRITDSALVGRRTVKAELRPAFTVSDQANRRISTGQLNALLRLHLRPIDVVVCHVPRARPCFEGGFPLRCLQRLSCPDIATLHCGWRHNRSTSGPSTPVLSY